ncbi:MAG: hypothetical protein LBH51_09775 [Treponema sp.]|jgi:hypothetical protein|nr:hypothetical protein [Treponema sp.]
MTRLSTPAILNVSEAAVYQAKAGRVFRRADCRAGPALRTALNTLGGILFFLVLARPASPDTLSFLVLETGPSRESAAEGTAPPVSSAARESSSLWETCLLDVFFEAGHVVSNSPSLRLSGKSAADFPGKRNPNGEFPREIQPELEDAVSGGADYLILALLSYPAAAEDMNTRPQEVNFRIYSFKSPGNRRFIHESAAPLESPAGRGTPVRGPSAIQSEREQAKRLIRGLIPHIKD